MIKKKLRVSPGSWMPLLASIIALATAASFAVFLRVTMEQMRFVPRILNPQADIDGNALDTMPWIGWCLMFGGIVLMVLFLWFAAKKAVGIMAIPALLYAVGAVLTNMPSIQNNTISTEQWIILIGIILVSWWFIMTVTNLMPGKIPAKELLILLAVIAAVGTAVLTFLQRAPFVIKDSCFAADNCLDLSSLVQVAGYFLTIVLFSVSLDNSFQAEVSAAGKDAKSAADDRSAKSGGRKQGADAKEPKSDGKTVNWALIRPTEENAKKASEAVSADPAEPVAETIGGETEGMESLDEANRRIAEMTANGPTFEEEMNLVGEIGERRDRETAKPDAAKNRAAAKKPVEDHIFAAEPGVEVVQYEAPVADDTPAEEKTLAQLLAERGLLNRTEDPIAQADAIKADEAIYAPYVEPVQEAKPLEAPKAEWEETGDNIIEETAENVADIAAEADTVTETAEAAVEAATDTAVDAADKAADAADKAVSAAGKAVEAEKKVSKTVTEAAAAAAAATAFSKKPGRKTVYDELEETPEEAVDSGSSAFAAKGKGTQNRVREAAEKVATDEPILTVPVTPVSGSRLQKVLKEEVITDRDQKLMYRRKVSVFAVIGMCLSVAAMVVGVLTTFDIVKIDMLKDDKSCLMMLGLGLVMFLVFGTRLTYKDYYTKTIVTERKVVHEESNWEEYVANRLEEDEKNIAALAQNYMRMTEMYGRLLETTAELTNNIKALSMHQQAGIAAVEPEPFAAEAAAPADEAEAQVGYEPFAEAPVAEEEFAEEPIKLMAVPNIETPAPVAESEAIFAEPEFTAVEEPVAEAVAEAIEETAEAAEEPVAEAFTEEFAEEPIKLMAVPGIDITAPAEEAEAVVAETEAAIGEVAAEAEEVTEEVAAEAIEPAAEESVAEAPVEEEFAEEPIKLMAVPGIEIPTEEAAIVAEPEIAEAVEEVAAEAVEAVAEEPVAEAVEAVAEEPVAEVVEAVAEEPVAEKPVEEEPKSTSGNANADILAALFSGRGKKTATEPEKPAKPAETAPAPEPVKKETEEEPKPTGSYNDFLISTMFGRKKDKPAAATEEPVKAVSEEIVEKAAEEIPEAVEEIAETVEEVPEAVEETVAEITEEIPETAEEAAEEIPEAVEEIAETVEEIPETVEETVTEITEEIPETAEEAAEEIPEAVEEITETVEEIPETVEETVTEITEEIPEAAEEISETVEEIPETVEETVTEFTAEIPEAAEEAVEEITEAAEEVPETVEEISKETFNAFDVTDEEERIPEYVSSPIGTTSEAVKAVTDSIQTPTWSIPSPMFGSFGYGATLAEEETEDDGGMKLQFSVNTMQEPMFSDAPMQNVYAPNSIFSEESVVTPTDETPVESFTAEEPVTEEPAIEEPAFEEPVAENFTAEEPAAEEPAVEEPAFEPAFESFTAEEPAAEEPAAEEPAVEEPVFEPAFESFTAEEPVAEEPAFEEPAFEEPAFEEPVFESFTAEEPVAEEPIVEEAIAEEPIAQAVEEIPAVKPEVPEWKPAEEQKKAPFYRPSIYSSDSPEDAVNDEEMPQVTVPVTPQRETAPKQDDGIIEGFVMPTFRGFTYSDDYEPTDDDTEEQMYNGSYKMKSFLSRKTAQSEQMNQYLYDSDDDDDFGIGADDTAGGQYHGAEIPEPAAVEDVNDMFAEPELPMTEADFAEPELPELETETWEEAPVPEPAIPTWDNSLTWRPEMSSIADLQEPEIPEPAAPAMQDPFASGMAIRRPVMPDTTPAETANTADEATEDIPAKPQTVLNRQSALSRMSMAARMPVMPETSLEDDWPMGAPSHPEEEKKPEPEESEEDARTRLENRRRMLQEKLDQIRKKNQATQFDDLSDLDDEGVFFNKK